MGETYIILTVDAEIQSVLAICRLCICKLTYSLKCIYNSKIDTHEFHHHRHAQSGEKILLPNEHIAS